MTILQPLQPVAIQDGVATVAVALDGAAAKRISLALDLIGELSTDEVMQLVAAGVDLRTLLGSEG